MAIGTTVEAGGSSYTLNEIRDPAPAGIFGVDAGKRLVALDITQVGMSDESDSYNALYFAVQDAEGYVYERSFSDADVGPSLGAGKLVFGQIVRGWVVIEVPETARLVSVLAEAEVFGSRVTIADLAEDQVGDLLSQTAPPLPSPPSTPVAIGTTVEAGGSSYTLNEIRDPAPAGIFGVDAGKRLVALDITQVGMSDESDSYNALYFAVQDAEGYVYERSFSDDVGPSLGAGKLVFGQIVRGWVVIEVPETARLVSVLAEAEVFGSRVTIADLAEDQVGDLLSQTAPPLPSPPSTPVAIGTTVEAGGSSYTLNEIRDPAPAGIFGVDAGKRLVALDITQVGMSDESDSYNALYFAVQDAEGYVYERSFSDADVGPSLGSGELAFGQIVRGWVVIEVPETARLVSVLAEAEVFGSRVTIADLAEDQVGDLLSQTAPPLPSPPSTPVAIGTTVEAGGSSYTLNEIRDPAPAGIFGVDAGKRLVALDITQVGMSDESDSYNALYFAVQDAEGYVYERSFSDADVGPSLGSGELAFGQIVRGWVVIEVPETARLVSVLAEAEVFGSRVTIADL